MDRRTGVSATAPFNSENSKNITENTKKKEKKKEKDKKS